MQDNIMIPINLKFKFKYNNCIVTSLFFFSTQHIKIYKIGNIFKWGIYIITLFTYNLFEIFDFPVMYL